MIKMTEGLFTYAFPKGWKILRLQDDEYYKHRFQGFNKGSKEMDFMAFDTIKQELWLLEAKDYRIHPRTKPGDLAVELSAKVRDSLACLEAMQVSAESSNVSRKVASELSKARTCRIVFHLELPSTATLALSSVDTSNISMRIRQLVRSVDRQALVGSSGRIGSETPIRITMNQEQGGLFA